MKSESSARPSLSSYRPLLGGALLAACVALTGCEMLGVKKSAAEPAATPVADAPAASAAPTGGEPAGLPLAATSPSSTVPSAVEMTAPVTPPAAPAAPAGQTVAVGLSMEVGVYHCELNRSLGIKEIAADGQSMVMRWAGRDYPLTAVRARSGALRYEDAASGLTWITIVGKSLLLDLKNGQQLANECKHAPGAVLVEAPPAPVKATARASAPRRKTAE